MAIGPVITSDTAHLRMLVEPGRDKGRPGNPYRVRSSCRHRDRTPCRSRSEGSRRTVRRVGVREIEDSAKFVAGRVTVSPNFLEDAVQAISKAILD